MANNNEKAVLQADWIIDWKDLERLPQMIDINLQSWLDIENTMQKVFQYHCNIID